MKAVNYLYLVAQQAMGRSAYSEAAAQLSAALELLRAQTESPERSRIEIAVLLSLAVFTRLCVSGGLFATPPVGMLEQAGKLPKRVGEMSFAARFSKPSRSNMQQTRTAKSARDL